MKRKRHTPRNKIVPKNETRIVIVLPFRIKKPDIDKGMLFFMFFCVAMVVIGISTN